ncbi:hypothetical protein [Protaetiibacter mangrovi]|uniref:Uncharacterized protein n=1 Tax=Protaetiibacter mangrovi TaxID=2970926 RepID=A0ABT1ZJ50_9MICO|nr:hypothetical protein [Protaetiibacter mangrovi]MCS0500744.1 hypothetical protein [Protaetiibacter mangrovi]TPX02791.1 hypothetical protein FJ656_20570 [Schumannella luteola]
MNDISDDAESRLRRAAALDAPELDPTLVTTAPDRPAPRMLRHGRAARAAGISITAVAAVSVGALVVPGIVAPRAPLFTAVSASGGTEASALSADSKLAYWVDYDYVAGPGLSSEGGHGSVYQLRRVGAPEEVLAAAAAALGLDGDPVESQYSSPDYPSYVVGPEDGSAASISLSWAGTGDWWYNDPTAYPAPVCVDTPVEGGDGETYQDCAQPEIPASESKAPSEAQARELAAELFKATGFDVAASEVRVTVDPWQTYASANLTVDGVATALEYSVAWSPLGSIAWAAGHSIEVVDRGGYDTVSPVSAVSRIADGRWFGAAGPDYASVGVLYAADAGLARDAAGAVSTDAATDAPADGDGASGSEGATVEPVPSEPTDPGDPGVVLPEPEPTEVPGTDPTDPGLEPQPVPTPETVTVTLDHAESTLLLLWDVDGNAWLVPGYAYENPDGDFWTTIVSLVEGVIALPEPVRIEPLIDPAPAEVQ